MKFLIWALIIGFVFGSASDFGSRADEMRKESVADLMIKFGYSYKDKEPDLTIPGVSARVGEDIVHNGFSKIKGEKKSKRQSKHFVCTSCHNVEREDPSLEVNDPQARLMYTKEKGIPFLQATTLYGAVNRESYYNGDYEKKYGDLVTPARNDIREAIQLCATECAQGRALKTWEIESIMAYLWEIDLKVSDLSLTDTELESVDAALKNNVLKSEGLKYLQSQFLKKSDATFVEPPADRKVGTGYPGDPKNGQFIYENSCLHCHYQKKYSFLHLDKNKMSFRHLDKKAATYSRHSLYQVVRYGTYSKHGKKSYMPRYTSEKMSDQQLADLRSYIEQQARL